MAVYGDNIFAIGAAVSICLRKAGWPRDKIDGVLREISSAKDYDAAVAVCRRYITVKNEER